MSLLWFYALIATSAACSCLPTTVEQAFCNSAWVSRVNVIAKEEVKAADDFVPEIHYYVKHIKVFKNKKAPMKLGRTITTAGSSAACGVDFLQPHKEYLLAGDFNEDGSLRISLCGGLLGFESSSGWDNVSAAVKGQLANGRFLCKQ